MSQSLPLGEEGQRWRPQWSLAKLQQHSAPSITQSLLPSVVHSLSPPPPLS